MISRLAAALTIPLSLAACVGQSEVLFVTSTNIGINFDTKPPAAAIDYDRFEGYIGPAYENGTLPPVASRLSSNLSVLNPEIRQVYATGNAAELITHPNPRRPEHQRLRKSANRIAYFATESSAGLKVTFTSASPVPDSMHLGYRRKEFSWIPVGTAGTDGCAGDPPGSPSAEGVDCYGSVLASIKLGANVGTKAEGTQMAISQFFATGQAADMLASGNDEVRKSFGNDLGITVKIAGDGTCDAACVTIGAFLAKDPAKKNIPILMATCVKPAGAANPTQFRFGPEFAAARADCVTRLPT